MSKSLLTLCAALAAVVFSPVAASPVWAMSLPGGPGLHDDDDDAAQRAADIPNDARLASGRIVAVDKSAGRVTIDYRPLPLLPEGGVRVFAVEDPASLKDLGPGDRVRFEVERDGRGFIVTRLENSN